MFDISWTEFLLIGVVALVVIGPKELPGVMRSLGQWTRKLRSMAADFQNQFQEAMREAEMADLKKQVDDIAADIKGYDPLKDVRADVESIGKDVQQSLDSAVQPMALEQKPETTPALPDAGTLAPVAIAPEPAAAAAEPAPEPTAAAAEPASTERSG